MAGIGKALIVCGILLIAAGIAFMLGSKVPFIGKLPGDIYVRKENYSFYFPLTTSLVLSGLISLVMYFLNRK